MTYRIRDWRKFQVFKDRRPPWVRLYRDLLDDPDWHELDGADAKILVMLWLIASEDDAMEGNLPSTRKLAFRLRMSEAKLIQSLNRLSHWLYQDDIKSISSRYQIDTPETETETETETDIYPSKIKDDWPEDYRERFWQAYPRKVGKGSVIRKLESVRKSGEIAFGQLIAAVRSISASEEKFIPHPLTWLNQGRYLDTALPLREATGPPRPPEAGMPSDAELRAKYADRGTVCKTTAESAGVLESGLGVQEPKRRLGSDPGGFERISSVGEILRNEGMGTLRNPSDTREKD